MKPPKAEALDKYHEIPLPYSTTDGVHTRCKFVERSRWLYFFSRFRQCVEEATDTVKVDHSVMPNIPEGQTEIQPMCRYHKIKWERKLKGHIEPEGHGEPDEKLIKPKMEFIEKTALPIHETNDGKDRCMAFNDGRFFWITRKLYQCIEEAVGEVQLPNGDFCDVCSFHKELWERCEREGGKS